MTSILNLDLDMAVTYIHTKYEVNCYKYIKTKHQSLLYLNQLLSHHDRSLWHLDQLLQSLESFLYNEPDKECLM